MRPSAHRAHAYFQKAFGSAFKVDEGRSDGYVPGHFVLELKGDPADWNAALFQGLAYHRTLDFALIIVATHDADDRIGNQPTASLLLPDTNEQDATLRVGEFGDVPAKLLHLAHVIGRVPMPAVPRLELQEVLHGLSKGDGPLEALRIGDRNERHVGRPSDLRNG